MAYEFLPGDMIGESIKSGPFAAIGPLTREPGEEKTRISHIEGVARPGCINICRVVGPRGLKVGEHPFPGLGERKQSEVFVWRHKGWSDAQREAVGQELLAQVGNWYAVHRLLGFAADNLIARFLGWFGWKGEIRVVSRMHRFSDLRVCSNVYPGAVEEATDYRFGRPADQLTPDGLDDWIRDHPDDWELVYHRPGGERR